MARINLPPIFVPLNVSDGDIKGLRETLCRAQAYIMHDMPGDTWKPHVARIQRLIDECDRHRPLGPDGVHGDLHTETCGCQDKGHGPWCDHRQCLGCITSLVQNKKCMACGHDWSIPEFRIAKCY